MNTAKSIIGLILSGIAIGLGLLLLSEGTQLDLFGPAAGWLVILLGVFSASSKYRGMRLLGFMIIAVGLAMWLRSADVLQIPVLRWSTGVFMIALGLMSIATLLRNSDQSSQS